MNELTYDKSYEAAEVKLSYSTQTKNSEKVQIRNSEDASELFFKVWNKEAIEHVEETKLILLNRANRVLGVASISTGGITGCIIDVRLILQYAITANATSIILAHNHPSGNAQPSQADINITKKVKNACEYVDIKLLDHLIITPVGKYFSSADEIGI